MKIVHQYFERAYGEGVRNYHDYSRETQVEFRKWTDMKMSEGFIAFNDFDELVFDGLDNDDKKRVKDLLKKFYKIQEGL